MFQTDQSTAASSLPTPATAGTPGYFTNGNPVSGTPATILDADFMNMLMMELTNLVTAAGLTPSKTNYTQVLASIKTLIQNGAANYGIDSGTANAYAVSYAVPVTAVSDGERLRFKASHANTGASTFSPNPGTVAAAAIWGSAHSPLQGGEIAASSDVEVVWNSSLNTTGAWVLLESTGGALQIAPGTQSNHAVNLGQFPAQLAASGYVKIPTPVGALILQWGPIPSTAANSSSSFTYPIAFQSNVYALLVTGGATAASATAATLQGNATALTGGTAYNWGSATIPQGSYLAIGK